MPHPSRTLVLVPPLLRTTSSTSGKIIVPEQYTSAFLLVDVTAVTAGTTLDIYVQRGIKNAGATDIEQGQSSGTVVWDDFANVHVLTAASQWTVLIVGSGAKVSSLISDAALANNTVANGPLGSIWRVKWTMVGTNYTFSVTAQFIP